MEIGTTGRIGSRKDRREGMENVIRGEETYTS